MPSQPGLVSGCRLDYMSSAGFVSRNVTKMSTGSGAVSCDNQTISFNGTAYDTMSRVLGCPHSGMTKCPSMRGNNNTACGNVIHLPVTSTCIVMHGCIGSMGIIVLECTILHRIGGVYETRG